MQKKRKNHVREEPLSGEWITLQSMCVFSDQFVNALECKVSEQDWTIPMNQFPTYPTSKVLLCKGG